LTDEIIEAAKTAAYQFRTRLASINSPDSLREFVDDYFMTPSEKDFWYTMAGFWELKGFEFWTWPPFKSFFTTIAYSEWTREKARFGDERARIGFKLGTRQQL
jgi:hypothetical protein